MNRNIENDWIKLDLHIHTLDDPKDKLDYSAHELLARARRLGFSVLAITLHDAVFDRPKVFADAQRLGILLIPAAEMRIEGADIILLNVTTEDVADLRTFVSRVENFLMQSHEGRRDVSAAIRGVVHCRLGPRVAIERLNRVQRNRQSLLQQVAALAVPGHAAAERSADLFQQAEQRSIAADWHYRDWLAKRTSCA